jgi:hypothetical protein
MSPEAIALARVLVDHHRQVRGRGWSPNRLDLCVIPYGTLCDKAGLSYLTRSVGRFLQEVAGWCSANGWPPINSLAVNEETRMPGEGYDRAPGCDLLKWPETVQSFIGFDGYADPGL